MNFEPIDKSKKTQTIRLFTSKKYDIDAIFTINNLIISEIEINVIQEVNNDYQLESALFCCNVVNADSYYLHLNLIKKSSPKNKPILANFDKNCTFEMAKGKLIFTDIYTYEVKEEEVTSCKIDIFEGDFNPNHDNGNIIIGHP